VRRESCVVIIFGKDQVFSIVRLKARSHTGYRTCRIESQPLVSA
jgi:hypothetical protein